MKILITSDFYLPSITGVTNVILMLKRTLEKNGHDVRVLTFKKNTKSYYSKEEKVYYFKSLKFKFYKDSLASINTKDPLMHDIFKWKPDIIHSQTEFFSMRFAKSISKKAHCPIIHTCHTNFLRHYKDFHIGLTCYKFFLNLILKKSLKYPVVKLITPSNITKNLIQSFNLGIPISVIPTAIDFNKFNKNINESHLSEIFTKHNIDNKKFKLITISRLSAEKNIEVLISNFSKLVQTNSNIQLIIVGDGPERKHLENQVNTLNLNHDIIFCGLVPFENVSEYYKIGDVFISAATKETQGLTYYEALASGLPIICFKDPVLDDVLIDKYNGYFFQTEEDFISKINYLINHEETLRDMKRNTVSSIQDLCEETFIKKIMNEYKSSISQYNKMQNRIDKSLK